MKIAISCWQGRVSPVFDVAKKLLLVDIADGKVERRENVLLNRKDHSGRAAELIGFGAGLLICGAVSFCLERILIQAGIRVVGFTCGDIEDLVDALLNDRLADDCFRMPGSGKYAAKGCVRSAAALFCDKRRTSPGRDRCKNGKTVNATSGLLQDCAERSGKTE